MAENLFPASGITVWGENLPFHNARWQAFNKHCVSAVGSSIHRSQCGRLGTSLSPGGYWPESGSYIWMAEHGMEKRIILPRNTGVREYKNIAVENRNLPWMLCGRFLLDDCIYGNGGWQNVIYVQYQEKHGCLILISSHFLKAQRPGIG